MQQEIFDDLSALDSSLSETNISNLVEQINKSLIDAGINHRIEKLTLVPVEPKFCRCLEYGIVGYETRCTPRPGGGQDCTRTPIYGCKRADCT
jgi:hypothetical protein